MKKGLTLNFIAHPDKVIINISKTQWNSLFSKWITRDDGSKVELFTDIEADEGYAKRYEQNVSVGKVVAVGTNVEGVQSGDMAILDYIVSNDHDTLIGYVNGDRLCAIRAKTTYHTFDAIPNIDGRKTFVEGDFDIVSPLLGVVREGKITAFEPYVFFAHKSNKIMVVSSSGIQYENEQEIVEREILAASCEHYQQGDIVGIKESDLFTRTIDGKQLSIGMNRDILYKK